MEPKHILVTGASGYIAGLLIPRLLEAGHTVRAMVRKPGNISFRTWTPSVEMVVGDVTQPESLAKALAGIHTAYYLVHNMASGHGYRRIELDGAKNFAQAAEGVGTEHIIYLGGLADPEDQIAPHMRSRIETGITLRKYTVPVTEFRAGVIAGPGSISFEMIRYLSEQFPLLVGPGWLKNRTQPISAENVVDYLVAALKKPEGRGQVFEIGGPDVYTYAETMLLYAKLRGLSRRLLLMPYLPTRVMAAMVGRLTPVPAAIAYPLIEGLSSDSVVKDPKALAVFPEIQLSEYRQAVKDSLAKLHPKWLDRIWIRGMEDVPTLKSEGFFVECLHTPVDIQPTEIKNQLTIYARKNLGDFQIESNDDKNMLLEEGRKDTGGKRWLEWEILPENPEGSILRQTAFYAPKGLPGFLARWRWQSEHRRVFREIRKKLG
ncbi:MAG: NAD(P)H-binding protein [Anaerolineales bacterium]|jgi:uncharacterized protein YbjT (DUF2867 family)